MIESHGSIAELLEENNEVFIACISNEVGAIVAEIQPSDYWVGGDEGGFTDDSNVFFADAKQAEAYYNSHYKSVYAFDNAYDADEKCTELEATL